MSTRRSPLSLITVAVALTVSSVAAAKAGAGELQLRLANDPVAGNPRPDDLYTSDLEARFQNESFRITAGERMFTDRSRGLRFDETHLSFARPVRPVAGWSGMASAGLLHAGRGLLGESVQNGVHRVTGSDRVELPYTGTSRTFVTAGLELRRPLTNAGSTSVRSELEGYVAPGFRSWLRAEVVAARPIGGSGGVELGAGARADRVETPWISSATIGGASATGHVSLLWRSLELRYAWNDYGTRTPHVSLGIRTPLSLSMTGR